MVRSVDLGRLLHRSVIEPKDDVAVVAIFVVEIRASDRYGLVGVVSEDGERAGSIESNSANRGSVNVVLI